MPAATPPKIHCPHCGSQFTEAQDPDKQSLVPWDPKKISYICTDCEYPFKSGKPSPCPKHDPSYVSDGFGHYINSRNECMRCHKKYNHHDHQLSCYTDLDASNISKNLTGVRSDEHEAYHFANNVGKIISSGNWANHSDTEQALQDAKDNMYLCDPSYNPYNDIFKSASGWGNQWWNAETKAKAYEEIMEANNKGIYVNSYGDARSKGATHDQILEIDSKHPGSVSSYSEALGEGANHNQCMESLDNGISLNNYAMARRYKATHDEIIEAKKAGAQIFGYAAGRSHKITHGDLMDATKRGIPTDIYTDCIANTNTDHGQMVDLSRHAKDPVDYNNYFQAKYQGLNHDNIMKSMWKDYNPYDDVFGKSSSKDWYKQDEDEGIGLSNYINARDAGATHNEILNSHNKGIDVDDYAEARNNGATHKEILDSDNKGINLRDYGDARRYGATHNEILDVHNKGINVDDYAYARERGSTHNEILDSDSKGIDLRHYNYSRNSGSTHNEILEAHNKGVNLVDYGDARNRGYTHEQAIREQIPNYNPYDGVFDKISSKTSSVEPTDSEKQDVHDKGLNLYYYTNARNSGATHNEILDAYDKGINLYDYDAAYARRNGATHKEILDSDSKGIDLYDYGVAREYGATHNEILDAHNKGFELYHYGIARYSGATHNEILEARNKGIGLYNYGNARYNGTTHNEILEAHNKSIGLNNYGNAREAGATHNEILNADSKGVNVYDYAYAREHNATHNEILETHEKGINLRDYGLARRNGATHNEILETHEKGINLRDYGFARDGGCTHEQAIKNQISNYNPYDDVFGKQAAIKPGLDDWWEHDPNETEIQQGQPSANWFDNWNEVPHYINDEAGRGIEENPGRGPAGIGDRDQAWRTFDESSNRSVKEVGKRRDKYPDHFSINEISDMLGKKPQTMRNIVSQGTFPPPDVKGTTTFRGDKGNLPALWHRDTIEDLVPLPEKRKESYDEETIIANHHTRNQLQEKLNLTNSQFITKVKNGDIPKPDVIGKTSKDDLWHNDAVKKIIKPVKYNKRNSDYLENYNLPWGKKREHYYNTSDLADLLGYSSTYGMRLRIKRDPEFPSPDVDKQHKNQSPLWLKKTIDSIGHRFINEHPAGLVNRKSSNDHIAATGDIIQHLQEEHGWNKVNDDQLHEIAKLHSEDHMFSPSEDDINLNHPAFQDFRHVVREDPEHDIKKSSISKIEPTYDEWKDAINKDIDVDVYRYVRFHGGATHDEALDAHEKGVNLYDYGLARQDGTTHNEILEAHNKNIDLDDYGFARRYGATHNEILNADSKGINLSHYGNAREYGATHNETLEIHNNGVDLNDYAYARNSGATHNEILEAHNKNIDLSHYGLARDDGDTHEQAMREQIPNYNPYDDVFGKSSSKISSVEPTDSEKQEAHEKGINLDNYKYVRYRCGATHDETLDAHDKGIGLVSYGYGRAHGVTHNEILDADNKGLNINYYNNARKCGTTHNQALDMANKNVDLHGYWLAIHYDATHDEALEAHEKGANLHDYARARTYGATHKEALEAHDNGINLHVYGIARDGRFTHEQAIKQQSPNYNPYDDVFDKSSSKISSVKLTDSEKQEAYEKGIGLFSYGYARNIGATHKEILEAHEKGVNLDDYGYVRYHCDATHNEILEAHNKGANLSHYGFARRNNATHNETLEAHEKGANLHDYASARVYGATHEQAIRNQISNYNPYDDVFNKSSSQEKCGKTFIMSHRLYDIPEDHYIGHDCCQEPWTCGLPVGHEGKHGDIGHSNQHYTCPNGGNLDEFDPSSYWWDDAPNPYDEVFKQSSKDWYQQDEDEDNEEEEEDDSTIEGRLGRCFQLAGRRASFGVAFQRPSDPNPILVHGTIQGMGLSPLAHAWVEHSDGTVHEPTTDQTYPKEMFNAIFNPVEEKRYDRDELNKMMLKHQHWGPWHDTKGRI